VGKPTLGSSPEWPGSGSNWIKSSLSFSNGNCVEVASLPDGGIGVRNSRDAEGQILKFTPDEWHAFLAPHLQGLELWMDVTRRRAAPSVQIQALTDTNAALQAKNAQLEGTNVDLKAVNDNLEHKIKSLQVTVTILLACCGGLGVGLAVSMAGAAAQTALASATGVFFAVIMASIAILTFMRR
jgi:hypothetical protein